MSFKLVEADVKPNQRLNAPSESATSSSVSYPQSLEEFFSRQQQQLFLLQVCRKKLVSDCIFLLLY